MQSKLQFVSMLLVISMLVLSCSKNDSPPVQPPPAPEEVDTLGSGWQRIKPDLGTQFEDIFFVNNQTGFLCGPDYVQKSVDGGLTWKQVVPDSLKQYFLNIFFADANNGWVTGNKFMLRTRNGGTSWEKIYTGPVFDAQFLDADSGFITIEDQGLYKTSDGGATLQKLTNGAATGLFFINQNKGWYYGNRFFKTENGGTSFSEPLGTPVYAIPYTYVIQFKDELHGWLAGESIFRTVDGGATLETVFGNIRESDVQFFDNNNGFILAKDKIYSTNDGGKTNTQLCALHKGQLIEISFTDLNHGWATGHGGYVYRYVKP